MKKKATASYQWRISKEHETLLIKDLDRGRTVTNDIQNIIEDLSICQGIDFSQFLILYRDSYGEWAGYNVQRRCFFPYNRNIHKKRLLEVFQTPTPWRET